MSDELKNFPEIEKHLDRSDTYKVSVERLTINGVDHLRVVQVGDIDGDVTYFRKETDKFTPVDAETVLSVTQPRAAAAAPMACKASPPDHHDTVLSHLLTQVNVFDSSSGPDHGNLACVWVVRHIAKTALRRWITETDHTGVFGKELKRCYTQPLAQGDVPPGGLVISPTVGGNVGHVGFLGAVAPGGTRLIYSNSSSRARFEQNFTISSWIARYKDRKGLEVLFYRLPIYEPAGVS